jgi:hypothetical protein
MTDGREGYNFLDKSKSSYTHKEVIAPKTADKQSILPGGSYGSIVGK